MVCGACYARLSVEIPLVDPEPPAPPPQTLQSPTDYPLVKNAPDNHLEELATISASSVGLPLTIRPPARRYEESSPLITLFQICVVFGMFWLGFGMGNWWNERKHTIEDTQLIENHKAQSTHQETDAKAEPSDPFHVTPPPSQ